MGSSNLPTVGLTELARLISIGFGRPEKKTRMTKAPVLAEHNGLA